MVEFKGSLWQDGTLVAEGVEGFYDVIESSAAPALDRWMGALTRFPDGIEVGAYTLRLMAGDAQIQVNRVHVSSIFGTSISFEGSGSVPGH